MWPATSVNARLGKVTSYGTDGNPVLNEKGEPVEISASQWLDQNQPVEQMTWAPGFPTLVKDYLVQRAAGSRTRASPASIYIDRR